MQGPKANCVQPGFGGDSQENETESLPIQRVKNCILFLNLHFLWIPAEVFIYLLATYFKFLFSKKTFLWQYSVQTEKYPNHKVLFYEFKQTTHEVASTQTITSFPGKLPLSFPTHYFPSKI